MEDELFVVTWLLLLVRFKEFALLKLLDRVILGSGFLEEPVELSIKKLELELLLLLGMPMKFFKVDLILPTMGMGSLLLLPAIMPDDPTFTGFGSCSSTISEVGMFSSDFFYSKKQFHGKNIIIYFFIFSEF